MMRAPAVRLADGEINPVDSSGDREGVRCCGLDPVEQSLVIRDGDREMRVYGVVGTAVGREMEALRNGVCHRDERLGRLWHGVQDMCVAGEPFQPCQRQREWPDASQRVAERMDRVLVEQPGQHEGVHDRDVATHSLGGARVVHPPEPRQARFGLWNGHDDRTFAHRVTVSP